VDITDEEDTDDTVGAAERVMDPERSDRVVVDGEPTAWLL